MPRYIDADKLIEKYERVIKDPWNKSSAPSSWAMAWECVIADIDDIPSADVVPKSEYDILNSLIGHKEEEAYNKGYEDGKADNQSEVETLKDNNEHLAVILEKTKVELKAMRGAANSLKMHYEKAKSEVASEIFAEIETIVDNNTYKSYLPNSSLWSKEYKIKQIITELAELKKKYTDCDPSPAPEEKYFSPQQVREMSPRELHDNFEAIKKSMELWQI